MLTLWNLFEASLLCLNAVCVLHEERFMQKMGWGANSPNQGFEDHSSVKYQILNLVRSIRTVTRRLTIGLGTDLHITSFVFEVNNQGILLYHNIELGSHFTFMFLMGYQDIITFCT